MSPLHGHPPRGKNTVLPARYPSAAGQTRDKTACYAGWSGKTYEHTKEAVAAAREDPEKYGPLVEEMDRTGRVNGVFKKPKVARLLLCAQTEHSTGASPTAGAG